MKEIISETDAASRKHDLKAFQQLLWAVEFIRKDGEIELCFAHWNMRGKDSASQFSRH